MARRFLGGTDMGPVVALYRPELAEDLARYSTAADVWMRLVHNIERPKSAAMQRGIEAEPRLRRAYLDAYGGLMEEHQRPWVVEHPRFPWATVSPDDVWNQEIAVGECGNRVYVEFKSASMFGMHKWGPAETDEIPAAYQLQVQHGLEILGLSLAHLFVGFGKDAKDEDGTQRFFYSETRRYIINRDPELAAMALGYAERFYTQHILTRTPPSVEPKSNIRAWKRLLKGEAPWKPETAQSLTQS